MYALIFTPPFVLRPAIQERTMNLELRTSNLELRTSNK